MKPAPKRDHAKPNFPFTKIQRVFAVMRIAAIGLFFLLGAGFLPAQETPRIRNFSPADYAAQNQNWALAQSAEGWLYTGNNGGLLEFDGARWSTFSLPDHQTVRAVATGRNGEIFCGGFAEFGYWLAGPDGRPAYHSLSADVRSDRLGQEEIWHILAGPDFVLFQSFSTIYKFDYQKITVLQPPASIMFAREVRGRIFLPVIGRGLYELLPDNTFRFVPGTAPLAGEIVQFIVPFGADGLWAGTTNRGIFEVSGGQCRPWANPLNAEFQRFQLNKATALREGGWAIGTILNGLYVLSPEGRLRCQINRENGLQNNTVLALLEDRAGDLWVGLDRGIDLVALHSPLRFFTDQSGRIGTVYSAARHDGLLYIGANQGVFARAPGGAFRLIEGTQGQVWQLQVFNDQLLCGHNSGTFAISGQSARRISDVTGGWHTAALPGRNDVLIQGTYTGLIVFRRDATGSGWRFSHRVAGFAQPLKKIVFDATGNLWGAHPNKGLYRLRLSDDLSQVEEQRLFTRADGLPSDFQLDLATVNGDLLVNSARGVLKIETENDRIVFEPVSEAGRYKWLPGAGGDYFQVDSSGIRLVSQGTSYSFSLPMVPDYENVVLLSEDEYLFCLENGFALLDKKTGLRPTATSELPVVRLLQTGSGATLRPIPGTTLQLRFQENNLRFLFAVPAFGRAPKFSWRLDGFSEQWSPWQTSGEKEFTNLPPGNYAFRVRTEGSGPETVALFRIGPPWYRSWWASLGYLTLILVLLWLVEKYNRNRLERQRHRLEADAASELGRQRAEAESEKLVLEVENKSRELSNAALNLIRKNEVLQRLKDELLDARNDPRALQKLARLIDNHLEGDHDWEVFEESFNRVHDDFFKRLMHDFSDLTPGDLRLAAYLKMNLSSKEIAPLLNISRRGVENKRYRLKNWGCRRTRI